MTTTIPQSIIDTLGYVPSNEQAAIVDSIFTQQSPKTVISAAAGSGKTSTLLLLSHMAQAQDLPPNVLYLVFSKAMQLESEAKFSGLAEVRTIDSIALQLIGGKTPVKVQLKSRDGYWFNSHVFDVCGHPKGKGGYGYIKGRNAPPAIANYIADEPYTVGQYDSCAARNLYKLQASFNKILTGCMTPPQWHDHCEAEYGDDESLYSWVYRANYLCVLEAILRLYQTGETTFTLNTFVLAAANDITDEWIDDVCDGVDVGDRADLYKQAVNHYRDMSDVALAYTLIMVDECQDLSTAKLAMCRAMVGVGSQITFVGDQNQSIFHFAGADSQSFAKIVEYCEGNVLPLSTCYRCDRSIVEWAQDYRSDIRARDGAGEGYIDYAKSVNHIEFEDWLFDNEKSRLLITRNNKPLTEMFLSLYRSGIKFRMSDRKITSIIDDGLRVYNVYAEEAGLTKVMAAKQWSNINARCIGVVIAEIDYQLGQTTEPHEIEQLKGHSEELHGFAMLFDIFGAKTSDKEHMVDVMRKRLIDPNSTLLLSTAHSSKGLEAESVIILGWDAFVTTEPTEWQLKRFTPEEIIQEQNLSYVAGTRAKKELCFVLSSAVEYSYGQTEVAA
jgi:hypothetical protein